jgi:hypothetical protein
MLAFITGCKSSSSNGDGSSIGDIFGPDGEPEDLNPADWDVYLAIFYDTYEEDWNREGTHYVSIMIINPTVMNGDVTFKIDGNVFELEGWEYWFFGAVDLVEGQSYNFEVSTGSNNYAATLQIPYNITSADFPQTFDPTEPYNVTWTLANNNKYQSVFAWSYLWDWEDEDNDQESEYFKEINNSARQHTFPANAIESFGPGTDYELGINQMDYKLNNKLVAVAVTQEYAWYYEDDFRSEETKETIKKKVLRIIEQLK